MRIGIDLMGGDLSPPHLFEAILRAATEWKDAAEFLVIATHSSIAEIKRQHPKIPSPIKFQPVSDTISMSEDPLHAIRRKKNSSLVSGVRLLKKKAIDAFISLGNTGALLASASLHLPHLPGIKRPALLVQIPTMTGSIAVLDVGGTVASKAQHLVQFAFMGTAFQRAQGIESPKVALLNIGVEAKKGTSEVQQAYQLLKTSSINFYGNVEGREIFKGVIDVLVTDGFTGNVLLKTTEGVSSFIFEYLQRTFDDDQFKQLKGYFNYREYGGAILCGVEGIVIKCHGNSSAPALFNGIKGATKLIQSHFIETMKTQLQIEKAFPGDEVVTKV